MTLKSNIFYTFVIYLTNTPLITNQHLTLHLQYQVPQKLYQAVETELNVGKAKWRILDLGCGTGLCGELLKPMAKELIGIDVSEKMTITAGNKNIYDKLENQTLQEALDKHQEFNLILAGDVFTYISELAGRYL